MAYFDANDVRFSDDGRRLIRCPKDFSGSYKVPFGVEIIVSGAFKECAGLKDLTLPKTIKTLESGAFDGVKNLTAIRYEGTLEEWFGVKQVAYINSSHDLYISGELLEDVVIPESCSVIPLQAFYYVRCIKSVVFHDGVTEIAESAFNKSSIPGKIVLPPNLKIIGKFAFLSCKDATQFEIPATVETIGPSAFRYCGNVKRYQVDGENLFYRHVGSDLYNKDCTELIAVANRSSTGTRTYTVHPSVEVLPDCVFSDMPESITLIVLRDKIKTISKRAFEDYKGKVEIEDTKAKLLEDIGFPKERTTYHHDYNPDLAATSHVIDYISNNPFRVLGIPAGASDKDITEFYNDLRVIISGKGPKMSLMTDEIPSLKPVVRTIDSLDAAYKSLQDEMSRLINSYFWFYTGSEHQQKLVQYVCKGDLDNAFEEYTENSNTNQNRYILMFLSGLHELAVESFIELVTERDDDVILEEATDLLGIETSLDADDIRKAIIRALLQIYDKNVLTAYVKSHWKYDADSILEYFEEEDNNPFKELKNVIVSAKTANETYSDMYSSASYLIKVANGVLDDTKKSGQLSSIETQDIFYEAGIQAITNCEKASQITSNRKEQIEAVYLMASADILLIQKDRTVKPLRDAVERIKSKMDIIPPKVFKEQDCRIYDGMVSWLLCQNISELVPRFLPVIGPLFDISIASVIAKPEPCDHVIMVPKLYFQEEMDLVCEMTCQNVMRIIGDTVKNKGKQLSVTDVKEVQLGYSLLQNIQNSLRVSETVKRGYLTKTIGALLLILKSHGAQPSYVEIFKFQSEEAYWKHAQNDTTVLLKYLSIYDGYGKHINEAKALMKKRETEDDDMWQKCKYLGDYKSYIKKSPLCKHKTEAEQKVSEKEGKVFWAYLFIVILSITAITMIVKLFAA